MTFQRTVAALAILKVNSDRGEDFIDSFVPFVVEALRRSKSDIVSLPEIQASIRDEFGINVPQGALSTMVGRVIRRGWATRADGLITRNLEAIGPSRIAPEREDFLAQYQRTVGSFMEYAANSLQRELLQDEASEALGAFLEAHAADVLRATVGGTPLAVESFQGGAQEEYLVARFILHAIDNDPAAFSLLEAFVKGAMLAGALLYPEPSSARRKFDGLEVYLDTRFVLQLLGWEGDVMRRPRSELLSLLAATGARPRMFEHTLREVRGVLSSALGSLRNPSELRRSFGPTIQYMIEAGIRPSDVELGMARLEPRLAGLGVKVVATPQYRVELTIDEAGLSYVYEQRVRQRNKDARDNDVASASAIFRLRGSTVSALPEKAKAVFVTTNDTLVRTTRDYFLNNSYGYTVEDVPIMLTADVVTTLAWLKQPTLAPELPRELLIADCYASTSPNSELWNYYISELDRMEREGQLTAEDFLSLRYTVSARNTLMEVTLGSPAVFAEGTVPQIMNRMREGIREEISAELIMTKEALAEEQKRRESAEQASHAASEELNEGLQVVSRLLASLVAWTGIVMVLGVCAIGVYQSIADRLLPAGIVGMASAAAGILVFALGTLQLADWATDWSGRRMYVATVGALARRIESWLKVRLGERGGPTPTRP
ncbi:MAG: hypothetical protein AMXMBFR80_26950 [Dehalococcoidia bacterium]